MLTHLFNAIIATRCVPSAWRQGMVVHLPNGGDTGDCSNCRPLTLLPVVDMSCTSCTLYKLFAKLLSERIARAVCMHDQQDAFRPGRGTLNPLQNVLAVVRQRTRVGNVGNLTHHVRRCACRCRGGAGAVRQRCLMAPASVRAPSVPSVQAMPDSSSHVIRCIRNTTSPSTGRTHHSARSGHP